MARRANDQEDDLEGRGRRARRRLLIAAGLAAAWWACLAALALFHAPPETLNLVQIDAADYVVTATVSAEAPGTIAVATEWKHQVSLGTIPVEDLDATFAVPGETYLVPLTRTGPGRYRITDVPQPGRPLIYAAGTEIERRLEAVLERSRGERSSSIK